MHTSSSPWVQHAIWWQIYPFGFVGAELGGHDQTVHHRLGRIIGWLDHAVELGASGILLGPIFSSTSHGYDTVDPFTIDSRLGDLDDFDRLVSEARSRGLRIMLDGVFNHVGRDFPRFARILAEGRTAPDQDWFTLYWPDDDGTAEPGYDQFEGHPGLVELNHQTPAVADFVVDVMRYWLDRGVDAWRLDAAYSVPDDFWADVIGRVRASHPDVYVIGEVIHGDYPAIVRATGMDSVTQYELWSAIRNSLAERNLYELAWSLKRHNEFLDTFVPLTFVGNHDVTRIASALDDVRMLPHAIAVQFLVGGTPTVYYGDEEGFQGIKEDRAGGDDAVRPAMPDKPIAPGGDGAAIRALHGELIGLRRRHPWLHHARTTAPLLANTQAVLESNADGHRLRLALNLDDEPCELGVPEGEQIIAGGGTIVSPGTEQATVTLPRLGWAVVADQS